MTLLTPNGHIVTVISDRYFIVDTGSPLSFNYEGIASLDIGDRTFDVSRTPVCAKADADRLTGIDISGIIGTDILKRTGLTIDLENKTLDFSSETDGDDADDYARLSFDYFMGHYLVTDDVYIGRRLNNAIIDTGAPVSYISSRLAPMFEPTGETYSDVSPSFGMLQGEYLRGEMVLSSPSHEATRPVKLGMMPELLDMFGMFDAILGVMAVTDKKIIFDFSNKELLVKI